MNTFKSKGSHLLLVRFVNISEQLEEEEARLLREQMSALMQQYMGKADTDDSSGPEKVVADKPSNAFAGLMSKYMNPEPKDEEKLPVQGLPGSNRTKSEAISACNASELSGESDVIANSGNGYGHGSRQ